MDTAIAPMSTLLRETSRGERWYWRRPWRSYLHERNFSRDLDNEGDPPPPMFLGGGSVSGNDLSGLEAKRMTRCLWLLNQGGVRFSPHWTAARGPENGMQLRVTKSTRRLLQLPRSLSVG